MDFSYSDDQNALRELTRKILEDRVTHDRLQELEKSEDRIDRATWQELAAANLLGLSFDEAHGGSGLGLLEEMIVLEEVGRTVAPLPVWETVLCVGLAVKQFGSVAQQQRLLPRIARGELVCAAALQEPGSEDPLAPFTVARADGGDFVLDGTKGFAAHVPLAERVLLTARVDKEEIGVFLLDPNVRGVSATRQETTNGEPRYAIELRGARVAADDVLAAGASGSAAAKWIADRAVVGLCAIALGVADRALERTAAYAREREQFDRPIGSFQAVHQRAGDAFIDVQAIRLTTLQAIHRLQQGDEADDAVAIAKYCASEAGNRIAYAAQHIHGGIGLDLDYPQHRYFLWAREISMTLGTATGQLVALGDALAADA